MTHSTSATVAGTDRPRRTFILLITETHDEEVECIVAMDLVAPSGVGVDADYASSNSDNTCFATSSFFADC
jgi:hypothetical protein